MKGTTLMALALVLVSAGCQETTTGPQIADIHGLQYAFSNPPPPPIDTGAVGVGQSTFSVLQVTYFFNPVGNAGYLKFDKNQDGSTEVDKNAQVRYSQGVFSGKGFVIIAESPTSELVIDLSTVTQASSFSSCSAPVIAPTATEESRSEGGCFCLTFTGVTHNGVTAPPYVLVPCGSERGIIPCVRPPDPTDA